MLLYLAGAVILGASELIGQRVSAGARGSFKVSVCSSDRVSEGSVMPQRLGAMALAWERRRSPGPTEGLVSCMSAQAREPCLAGWW